MAFTHCLAYPSESLVNFLGAHRGSEGQVRIALEYMDCGSLKDHIQHLKVTTTSISLYLTVNVYMLNEWPTESHVYVSY